MNTSTLLLALITGRHWGKVFFFLCPPTPPRLPLQQGRTTSECSLWSKDTNNWDGLDCNPVFTFICHILKGGSSMKHGILEGHAPWKNKKNPCKHCSRMRIISFKWQEDSKHDNLTHDEKTVAWRWIDTVKDTVEITLLPLTLLKVCIVKQTLALFKQRLFTPFLQLFTLPLHITHNSHGFTEQPTHSCLSCSQTSVFFNAPFGVAS